MNFMAKVFPPVSVIPQIHSNSDGILIPRIVNPTFLNPVGSKLQKQALERGSTANVAVMDVSWYVVEYALVAQGHCFRASMWAGSSMERLTVFEIPWSLVTNKISKLPETPRPDPTPGPAAATFDYVVVFVVVHLVNKPVSDVWSTPSNGRVILFRAFPVESSSPVLTCKCKCLWMDGYWVGGCGCICEHVAISIRVNLVSHAQKIQAVWLENCCIRY